MSKKDEKAPHKKMTGRPSKYRPEFCEQGEKLCRLGATDKDLADFFEVNETTIYQWKKDYIEFSKSLKNGKILADAEVADKLYKRATGYETPDGKYYPPDTTAAIFWLKNRRPNLWRENQNINEEETQATPVKIEINVQDARIKREFEGLEE